jgi:hypothetical protein
VGRLLSALHRKRLRDFVSQVGGSGGV